MSRAGRRHWIVPAISMVLALALSVVPLPANLSAFRPDWVAVALLYWCLIEPRRYGLFGAFWVGLLLDTLSGSVLGQHSLALLVIVYLSQRFYVRIRTFPGFQVAIFAVALLGLYEFILFWTDGIAGHELSLTQRLGPVLAGGLVWLAMLLAGERSRQEAQARM
jgi:rod shape-determining protein MreD